MASKVQSLIHDPETEFLSDLANERSAGNYFSPLLKWLFLDSLIG